MKCKACQCDKSVDEFQIDRKNLTGRKHICKSCTKVYRHACYVRNKSKYLAYSRRWRAANPDKYRELRFREKLRKATK